MFLIFKSFFNKFLSVFDFSFEPKVKNLMTAGVQISFILVLFATLIMSIYLTMNQSYIVYEIGSSLFKSFTMFMAIFFITGIAFNTILKEKTTNYYLFISSINILFNICGFALPFVAFIACPTKNPKALSFPAL